MMIVFHEIQPDALGSVLTNGLKRTSRGEKGDDPLIAKADQYLDARCTQNLKELGVSRDNNIYAYVYVDGSIIHIKNGEPVPAHEFVTKSNQSVLQLEVDVERCFVSDLDTFDALKSALNENNLSRSEELAKSYWDKLIRLNNFEPGTIRRPEIMITYDLTPENIQRVQ